jgi:hypothetical protein
MSDLLPTISRSLEVQRGARAQRRTDAVVFQHGLETKVRAEIDQIDSQALGDALRVSLNEEVALPEYGKHLRYHGLRARLKIEVFLTGILYGETDGARQTQPG